MAWTRKNQPGNAVKVKVQIHPVVFMSIVTRITRTKILDESISFHMDRLKWILLPRLGKRGSTQKIRSDIIERMSKDMLQFGKVTMPNMFTVPSPPFHRKMMASFLDKDVQKLNIIAPRGHAKSSIAACVFPVHHIFFDEGPKFIVLCSKTQGHAIDLL